MDRFDLTRFATLGDVIWVGFGCIVAWNVLAASVLVWIAVHEGDST